MDSEIRREITSLNGEKKMSEMAVRGYQNSIAEQLRSSMGKDMDDVLEGRKKVEFTFWQKIRNGFNRLLWNLNLGQ